MAILKTAAATENRINKILSDRVTETADLQEQVEKENAAIEAANKAMEAATMAGDVKAYQKAKGERRDVTDAKEMHESRLLSLNEKPLISRADYEKEVSAIFADFAALEDQTKQKLVKLSDEMNAVAAEFQEAIVHANEVLHSLQHDIYRDADRQRDKV